MDLRHHGGAFADRTPHALHRTRSCGNALSFAWPFLFCGAIVLYEVWTSKNPSGANRFEQRLNAEDLHRSLHVVCQHLQTELGLHIP